MGEIGYLERRFLTAGTIAARRRIPFRRAHDCNSNKVSRTELPCCRSLPSKESAGLLWGKLGAANRAGRPRSRGGKATARFVGEIGYPEQRYRAAESPRSRRRGPSGERTIATLVENWVCPNSATVLSESSWSRGGQSRSGVRTIQPMLWEKLGAANTATVLPRSRGGQRCQSSRAQVSVPEGTLAVAEVRG